MSTSELSGDATTTKAREASTKHRAYADSEMSQISMTFKRHFASRADVVLAFLFGSYAKGKATRRSDVDVAVYFPSAHERPSLPKAASTLKLSRAILDRIEERMAAKNGNTQVELV